METSLHLKQNARIFQVYNIYRIFLSLILLLSFLTTANTTKLGSYDPQLFLGLSLFYCLFSLIIGLSFNPEKLYLRHQHLVSAMLIADILVLTLLTYSGGGMVSGLGLLLLVPIATGGILITGKASTLLAAIASISLIFSEAYIGISSPSPDKQYVQSGLLGALLFATSLYIQWLSERIRKSATLAEQQATSIIDLEQLNHLVIQRLKTGIIVVDTNNRILTQNAAAIALLELGYQGRTIDTMAQSSGSSTDSRLPEPLENQLKAWRDNPDTLSPPFRISHSGPQLQASFAYLNPIAVSNILVFIEDNSQLLQRAKQFKLASLGRLTANIAHEVRNPLGAISHAAQLLKESTAIADQDQRILEIILKHSNRVNLIIENVLKMSRQKEYEAETIPLQHWLENFIKTYESGHGLDGNITLEKTTDKLSIRVITSQLEQILTNLFENGLRYSKRKTGEARLEVKTGALLLEQNQRPFIHIIDEGPGISPEQQEHLFEPFNTTEAEGTGLGLYISKELCEANQAQLAYRKTGNGKSCFSIYFNHLNRYMV
ncbi:MAG: ATP-binding protein [Pseudomonadales bacterium]|nr:ATP-binding protein [Pseudomonadales bacterium]